MLFFMVLNMLMTWQFGILPPLKAIRLSQKMQILMILPHSVVHRHVLSGCTSVIVQRL